MDIRDTLARRIMADDHGNIVGMNVNTVSTLTTDVLGEIRTRENVSTGG